jgi:hypothetical protein
MRVEPFITHQDRHLASSYMEVDFPTEFYPDAFHSEGTNVEQHQGSPILRSHLIPCVLI